VSRRCVFLDRDGVINVKPEPGKYVSTWEQFHFLPNISDWIRLFNALGFLVIVLTNQRGIAKLAVRKQDLSIIHANMIHQLALQGARIDDIFYCPHEEHTCDCRKPAPGLLLQAQRKWDIDLATSIFIGDSDSDRKLAEDYGLGFVSVSNGRILEITARAQSITQ
jgi:histidinol-phosphate phosphatase family protein